MQGTYLLGVKASWLLYTPWYFYGFKFSVSPYGEIGMVSPSQSRRPADAYLYGGLGISLVIKNDNLIFPPFYITLSWYPGNQPGIQPFQLDFNVHEIWLKDFNPAPPGIINIYD
jgi:hypothetical protein